MCFVEAFLPHKTSRPLSAPPQLRPCRLSTVPARRHAAFILIQRSLRGGLVRQVLSRLRLTCLASSVSLLPVAACCDVPPEPHARVPAVTNRHHSRIPVHKQAHPPVTQHHIGVTSRPFQHFTSPVHTQHGRIRQAGCPACSTRRDALCLSSRHQICDQRTRSPRRGFGVVLRAVAPPPLLLP